MNTKKYRTKTQFLDRDNGRITGEWLIGIDLGYSAVKLFSPNSVDSFPSYARRVNNDFQFAGKAPENAILYRDNSTKQLWLVGEVAQNTMETGDTSDSEATLYGRERYDSPLFKVIMQVGLGIGMLGNEYAAPAPEDKIIIQTGLPQRYLDDDTELIIEAFAGEHNFSLKLGDGEWMDFRLKIDAENVFVLSQPKGSLFSVCINQDGKFNQNAKKYLSSSVIVFDPGFGTLDLFPINSGVVGTGETYADLGMKRVLQETSRLIQDKYKTSIPVPAMQKYLEVGTVRCFDKKNFSSKEVPFDTLLAEASNKVCEEAIARMAGALNLVDYNYLIITGGTGAAWFHRIRDKFANFSTLTLLQGNCNDETLPGIYSNVRGYYYYRLSKRKKELTA